MKHDPVEAMLADLVADYLDHCTLIYPESHEPANCAAALARLVKHARKLNARDIRHALDILELETQLSISYRRAVFNRWKRFLRWAIEHEQAPASLLVKVSCFRPRFRTAKVPFDDTQRPPFEIGHYHIARPHMPKLCRDVVDVLAYTGARPSDILRLQTRNIDIQTKQAICRIHKSCYRLLPKPIPIPPRAWRVIEDRLKPFCPDDWLFPAPKNPTRPCTTNTIAQQLRRTISRNKLPHWTLYDLRRYAAQVVRQVLDLDHAQALLGHRHQATTEIYAPTRLDLAHKAAQALQREIER